MSLTVQVQVDDQASPSAFRIRDELGRADVRKVMGQAVAQTLKDHFTALANDSQHHRTAASLGANRTGFYARAASGVQQPNIESDGFSVSINAVGIAQRLFGGTIEPVNAKFLTIPARAESYGKRAREFDNLKFILFPSGLAALVDKNEPAHEGSVYFWLVKKVVQQADPTVLPSDEKLMEPAIANARAYVERLWEREAA